MRSYILILTTLGLIAGLALFGCSGTANGDMAEETAEETIEEALEAETGEAVEETIDPVALLEDRCTTCHGLDKVEDEEADAAEWEDIIDHMIGMGADLDDEERAVLLAYLTEE